MLRGATAGLVAGLTVSAALSGCYSLRSVPPGDPAPTSATVTITTASAFSVYAADSAHHTSPICRATFVAGRTSRVAGDTIELRLTRVPLVDGRAVDGRAGCRESRLVRAVVPPGAVLARERFDPVTTTLTLSMLAGAFFVWMINSIDWGVP